MSDQAVLHCARRGGPSLSLTDYLLLELQSTSVKSEELFVELECSDGTRHIHRLILRAKVPDFDEIKRKVPVSAAIFDQVIQYLYKGEVTSVGSHDLIEVLKAATWLDCSDLQREIKHTLQWRLPKLLRDAEFLKDCSKGTSDSFAEVLEGLRFNEPTILDLAQRLAPYFSNRLLRETVFSCRGSRRLACFFAYGELRDAMTLQKLPGGYFSSMRYDRAIIRDGKIFAPKWNNTAVLIQDVVSGKILQEIEKSGLKGITFSRGELFAWTSSKIYLLELDQVSGTYSLQLVVTSSVLDEVCVIKRTADGITFANGCAKGVKVISAQGEPSTSEKTIVREAPYSKLVGIHENAVIVRCPKEKCFLNLNTWQKVCAGHPNGFYGVSHTKIFDGYLTTSVIFHDEPERNLEVKIYRTDLESGKHSISESHADWTSEGLPLIPCL